MEGQRIEDLQQALKNLAGADTSTQGSFARFRNREVVTLIEFNTFPLEPEVYQIPEDGGEEVLAEISARADQLFAGGDTAIYDALIRGYEVAEGQVAENPDAYTSIVLMTDGELTVGQDLGAFQAFYEGLPAEARSVPTFTILFGESSVEEMQAVARLTGGRVFDAREGELSGAFQEIRGYQ
jgi:Ca-activated chloride channel family protein